MAGNSGSKKSSRKIRLRETIDTARLQRNIPSKFRASLDRKEFQAKVEQVISDEAGRLRKAADAKLIR